MDLFSDNMMQDKIDKKQEECSLAEAEYAKYCTQFDAYLKELQDIKADKFVKENELRSLKYRAEQYDVSMNRAYDLLNESKEKNDKMTLQVEKEKELALQHDEEFNNHVISLGEDMHNHLQINDRNVIDNEIMELSKNNEVVNKELQQVRDFLSDCKKEIPLTPNKAITLICLNMSKIISDLEEELEKLKSQILTLERRRRQLEANKSLLI